MQIIVDGTFYDVPYKRMRVDALMKQVGLDFDKTNLIEYQIKDRSIPTTIQYVCLKDVIEIFDGMVFTTTKK